MSEYKDLEICTYFPLQMDSLIAVGWLSKDSTFDKGASNPSFFDKLSNLAKKPWQPIVCAGFHECELCQFKPATGKDNIFIPYQGQIFVAPELIIHYIATHYYKPPNIFIEAVMNCPGMNSMEYKKAIISNNGKHLLKMHST